MEISAFTAIETAISVQKREAYISLDDLPAPRSQVKLEQRRGLKTNRVSSESETISEHVTNFFPVQMNQ